MGDDAFNGNQRHPGPNRHDELCRGQCCWTVAGILSRARWKLRRRYEL
jgi:hypothetical protein